ILPDILKAMSYPDWITFGGGHFALMIGTAISPIVFGFLAGRGSSKQLIFLLFGLQISSIYSFLMLPTLTPLVLLMLLFTLLLFLGLTANFRFPEKARTATE